MAIVVNKRMGMNVAGDFPANTEGGQSRPRLVTARVEQSSLPSPALAEWVAFSQRLNAMVVLIAGAPQAMVPMGWANVLRLPLAEARIVVERVRAEDPSPPASRQLHDADHDAFHDDLAGIVAAVAELERLGRDGGGEPPPDAIARAVERGESSWRTLHRRLAERLRVSAGQAQ